MVALRLNLINYISTGINWQPNNTFDLALTSEDGIQGLKLNGTQFAGNNDTNIDGMTGLFYGRLNNIDFYDFSVSHPIVSSDSQHILLEDKSLPENNFIHIYDSSPYKITEGHISAKLPCDEDNGTDVRVLMGQIDKLQLATLQSFDELSTPGDLCQYGTDIRSTKDNPITDIVIQNNSTEDIEFPSTSSIFVSVSEMSKFG